MQTLLMIACLSASGAIADDDLAPSLDWVRSEGFRMGYNYKAPLDWYARAKACGMNGIISRLEIANDPSGDEELPENAGGDARSCWEMVRPSSRLAKQHGLRFLYMLNLGGSRGNIDDGYRDNPRRFNNGRLFSPIDEIYWTRVVEDRFLRVADMLDGDEYQIDGFLIDPEMYAENGAVPADIDYGDYALTEFAAASGEALEFEGLTIPERAKLIDDRGLTEDLYDFEFERIRDLAIATREKLQARVPDAIMGTFLWHDHLWFKAVVAGLSTPRVPCFVGPESTYPGSYDDQFLAHRDNIREQAGVPIFCVPGLRYGYEDGDAREEFLKVLPGNLYARSTATEGYWFWALTRLGETDEERKPFIDVLSQVNGELDRYAAAPTTYESALKPAPLPVGRPRNLQELLVGARGWFAIPDDALPADDPGPAGMGLRGMHAFAIRADEGESMRLRVQNVRLGTYTAPTACTFYRPDGSALAQVDVALGTRATLEQTADPGGVWVAGITSHNNAFWILPEARRCVMASDGPFGLCKTRGGEDLSRFFFYVPRGTDGFEIDMISSQAEAATFSVFRPDGERIYQERITETTRESFAADDDAGKIWWLETSDVVEDHGLELHGIPNLIAARADQLLAPKL